VRVPNLLPGRRPSPANGILIAITIIQNMHIVIAIQIPIIERRIIKVSETEELQ
jgi:hypothetical protein